MLGLTPRGSGSVTLETTPLGKGGEGEVFSVLSHTLSGIADAEHLVAKTYFEPDTNSRREKLKAMISSPVAEGGVAWPVAMLFTEDRDFKGYLMPKLESKTNREWLYLANAKDRRNVAPDFDVRYALVAVRNLAAAMLAVHNAGHRIGDVNESNITISANGTIFIVDTDSMQIRASDGTTYPCTVGKPEYTAPELSHGSLRDHQRTRETDVFAFAVAAYQLLTGGATPHQGVFDPNNPDDPMSNVERIRKGILPNLNPNGAIVFGFQPKPGVPVEALPSFLKDHLIAFLSVDPADRLSPNRDLHTLIRELDAYVLNLVQCGKQKLHWHQPGSPCGWCAAASKSGIDPWAAEIVQSAPKQMTLPAIGFGSATPANPTPQRAAPAIAGQQAHQANQYAAGAPHAYAPAAPYPGQYPSQSAQTAAPQRPKKIKGKITVAYADGTWGVRPPLSRLFRQSPRMAIHAMKEETPNVLKFWWSIDRALANPAGVALGFLMGLVFAFAWPAVSYQIANQMPNEPWSLPLVFAGLGAGFTAFLASTVLSISALVDRAKARKQGPLSNFKSESLIKTLLWYVPIGFFYGMPIVIILAGLLLFGLVTLARAAARA